MNQWWGYMHTNGKLQVKRFFSQEDIIEARQSDFVEYIVGVVEADSHEEAEELLKKGVK